MLFSPDTHVLVQTTGVVYNNHIGLNVLFMASRFWVFNLFFGLGTYLHACSVNSRRIHALC